MNIWATICLILLTLLVPVMAFGLGIVMGSNHEPSDSQRDVVFGWIIGVIGLAVTLANAIYLLS